MDRSVLLLVKHFTIKAIELHESTIDLKLLLYKCLTSASIWEWFDTFPKTMLESVSDFS